MPSTPKEIQGLRDTLPVHDTVYATPSALGFVRMSPVANEETVPVRVSRQKRVLVTLNDVNEANGTGYYVKTRGSEVVALIEIDG
jgi:hypothetical protein